MTSFNDARAYHMAKHATEVVSVVGNEHVFKTL